MENTRARLASHRQGDAWLAVESRGTTAEQGAEREGEGGSSQLVGRQDPGGGLATLVQEAWPGGRLSSSSGRRELRLRQGEGDGHPSSAPFWLLKS